MAMAKLPKGEMRPVTREDYRVVECDGTLGRKFAVQDLTDDYVYDEGFETREAAEKWIENDAPQGMTNAVPKKAASAGGR